jgi:hypothetical protein
MTKAKTSPIEKITDVTDVREICGLLPNLLNVLPGNNLILFSQSEVTSRRAVNVRKLPRF